MVSPRTFTTANNNKPRHSGTSSSSSSWTINRYQRYYMPSKMNAIILFFVGVVFIFSFLLESGNSLNEVELEPDGTIMISDHDHDLTVKVQNVHNSNHDSNVKIVGEEATSTSRYRTFSLTELQGLVNELRGNDNRLVRWDATAYTRKKQRQGGCDKLADALDIIVAAPIVNGGGGRATTTTTTTSISKVLLACEFATFCVTDNPVQRARLSQHNGIHKALVEWVTALPNNNNGNNDDDDDSDVHSVSAMASHLIYIASFSNQKNQQAFVKKEAIEALGTIVKSKSSQPIQLMWAAAALQNLAASYCDTPDDGRCYWQWTHTANRQVIARHSLPLISDGTLARQQILHDKELVQALVMNSCTGPVQGAKSDTNPFPGINAVAGRDDQLPTIIPWAAMGVLKNIALEFSNSARSILESAMPCVCRMENSLDWLEENKANGVLSHMRREADPCWFGKSGDDYHNPHATLCVDRYFLDEEGYDCFGYAEYKSNSNECSTPDVTRTTTAKEACCPCGGGTRDFVGTSNTK